jgi:hypothetical protein|tara:strand:- start:185 stop:622 length:438 start_codon:yes stop_codon:yes gene_type:complete
LVLVQAIQIEVEHHLVLLVLILLPLLDLVAVEVVLILMILLVKDQQLDLAEDLGVVVEHQTQEVLDNHHNPMHITQQIMVMQEVVDPVPPNMLPEEVVVPVVLEVITQMMRQAVMAEMVNNFLHIPHLYYKTVFPHPSGLHLVQL